jgi:hypothetical protein
MGDTAPTELPCREEPGWPRYPGPLGTGDEKDARGPDGAPCEGIMDDGRRGPIEGDPIHGPSRGPDA